MSHSIRKPLIHLGLLLTLITPTLGFCGIWDLTRNAVEQSKTRATYSHVVKNLRLLSPDEAISTDGDTRVLAGGYIVINPDGIRTFKTPGDREPEFEFKFDRAESVESKTELKDEGLQRLQDVRIALDVIPTHDFFKAPIGSWTYEKFVVSLQASLENNLGSHGAKISILRPQVAKLTGELFDDINKNPPHIVISPQFNNDKQDCMVTFCGGNITGSELKGERQRARFVEAVLTGKHLYSAELGVCIARHCMNELGAELLDWRKASFEGNARPIAASEGICSDARFDGTGGNLIGVAMRNLIHNGLFAKAVVVPFPDMQWILKQVKPGHEAEWISKYSNAITAAVLEYASEHPTLFERSH